MDFFNMTDIIPKILTWQWWTHLPEQSRQRPSSCGWQALWN